MVHSIGSQPHADHHRDDVPGMLTEGGKAHDRENAAQCGAVEIPTYQQNIGHADEAVQADIDQHRPTPNIRR